MANITDEIVWFAEDPVLPKDRSFLSKLSNFFFPQAVISPAGLERIAGHRYVSGAYTYLDGLLNPFWTGLTGYLPLWLAPNAVTTLGGCHCLASFVTLWRYRSLEGEDFPSWVLLFCGYCTFAYYTLDCMDGKQARRTGSSSPLGQLFDHGFDCLCLLSHVSNCLSLACLGGTRWFLACQCATHLVFFAAQWVEYHTGALPTEAGGIGVTEWNYGVAALAIANAFVDRPALWRRSLGGPAAGWRVNEGFVAGYFAMCAFCFFAGCGMVKKKISAKKYTAALAKTLSPAVLAAAPFLLPDRLFAGGYCRHISLATGLLFTTITIKLIVFGMAKMTYAAVQLEIVPFCAFCVAARVFGDSFEEVFGTTVERGLAGITLWNGFRLLGFVRAVVEQICRRLDIYCFTIKKKQN
uniref:CDP-alcohol phosphatidyltransferase n=1 Tax=Corethron hystrix TaxID=216773 RepID=A0A7S1BEY7_9STRA|mmetsp:Transcript_23393/g.53389  ORF Transcript_23393/g.53389 Transcript_23393/m.53389 type:complete len:409 (+) Transcript_23393:183-1409(+)